MDPDTLEYLRKREADERSAAEAAACMARTAHEDLADTYAERAAALVEEDVASDAAFKTLLHRID